MSVCRKMNGKYVLIFESTGEDHISALNEDNAIQEGLRICNEYRKKVGLPPLSRKFEEIKDPQPIDVSRETQARPYRKLTDKEKRAKAWLEKWRSEQAS